MEIVISLTSEDLKGLDKQLVNAIFRQVEDQKIEVKPKTEVKPSEPKTEVKPAEPKAEAKPAPKTKKKEDKQEADAADMFAATPDLPEQEEAKPQAEGKPDKKSGDAGDAVKEDGLRDKTWDLARRIAKEQSAKVVTEVVNKFGVAKLADVPDDKLAEVFTELSLLV